MGIMYEVWGDDTKLNGRTPRVVLAERLLERRLHAAAHMCNIPTH